MKTHSKIFIFLFSSCLVFSCAASGRFKADKIKAIPEFQGYVNDYCRLLTKEQSKELSGIMHDLFLKQGPQMAILIIDSTYELTIEEYSLKVAESWGLGRKNRNDGILFTFAMKDKKLRIEVGTGLEHVLTSDKCEEIIKDMLPFFQEDRYYQGISAGILKISGMFFSGSKSESERNSSKDVARQG